MSSVAEGLIKINIQRGKRVINWKAIKVSGESVYLEHRMYEVNENRDNITEIK